MPDVEKAETVTANPPPRHNANINGTDRIPGPAGGTIYRNRLGNPGPL